MQFKATQDSMPAGHHRLLYPLMVIAAISVIVLSLVGVASVTGLIPRGGSERPSTESIREQQQGAPGRPQGSDAPAGKQPGPAIKPETGKHRRIARGEGCGSIERDRSAELRERAAGAGALAGRRIGEVRSI
jgi:outer membrane lipoprotein SlyB